MSLEALQVKVQWGEKALGLLDNRWDALLLRQAIPNPTLSATWLREMAITCKQTVPFVIVINVGDRFVAGGAFELVRPAGRLGPRVANWLGRQLRSLYAPTLLIDPDITDAGLLLVNALFDEVHAVLLGPTPLSGATSEVLRARARWFHFEPMGEGFIVPLPPADPERRKKEFAYELRRASRLGATVSISVVKSPETIASALERLFILHQERWKGRHDHSRFSKTEEQRAWHRRAVAAMAARGEVRIVEVFEDGQLVSSAMGLLAGRGALFHTTATRVGGRLKGPGHASLLSLIEAACNAGAEIMDLGLGGNIGGPKADLGPIKVLLGTFQAGRSLSLQRALMSALSLRAGVDVIRSRLNERWGQMIRATRSLVLEKID